MDKVLQLEIIRRPFSIKFHRIDFSPYIVPKKPTVCYSFNRRVAVLPRKAKASPTRVFPVSDYNTEGFYDEMFSANGQVRAGYDIFRQRCETLTPEELIRRQQAAERALMAMGITFNVYSEGEGTERIMPIDIIPRIVEAAEWNHLERGLIQRIKALNLFIHDVYNTQNILHDGVVPRDLIESSKCFLKPCIGLKPPKDIWCHITGTDLIRGRRWPVYGPGRQPPVSVGRILYA